MLSGVNIKSAISGVGIILAIFSGVKSIMASVKVAKITACSFVEVIF